MAKPSKEMTPKRRKYPRCPVCGGESAKIVYGLIPPPSPEEEADMVLGGCQPDPARWECKECENSWPNEPDAIKGFDGMRRAIGQLELTDVQARQWLSQIDHVTCDKAIRNGAWETHGGVARPKSILWLDCWARTGMNSDKAKYAAIDAFEAIFGINHRDFSSLLEHEFSRKNRYCDDDSAVLAELKRRLS